ncbi:hypothetical protein EDD27_3033 [Nonomuraea polychroma]|uniref:Uncharacterized protein n=1 Tax=Nonomuraea polychroma TaxID=46176 RepID=A0A438M4V8_9ACTN|nr:hypothetical protein EDD27_3033 [Nonomuraea polychroma]
MLETTGSVDWFSFSDQDEMRFAKQNRHMASLWFRVPEEPAAVSSISGWLDVPVVAGLLACSRDEPFHLASTAGRWCAPGGRVLIGIDTLAASVPSALSRRLRVGMGFDLLLSDDRLVGWLLEEPERYLQGLWEPSPNESPSDAWLGDALEEYLDLVSFPNIEKIQEGESTMYESLNALRNRLAANEGAFKRRAALRKRLDELITDWYG